MRDTGVVITIRFARDEDDDALSHLDFATMSPTTSPGVPPATPGDRPFFNEHTATADVLVADDDGTAVGYIKLERPTPLPSHRHVLMVSGLAVEPGHQNAGIGKLLIDAAVRESELRGARKLGLRVLNTNQGAQRLYEKCGFSVEGVLRDEFLLDNRYVSDILMARVIGASAATEVSH